MLIPIFAVLFYARFFRKRKYLVQHVVVATHFWSFSLLLLGVLLPLAMVLLVRLLTVLWRYQMVWSADRIGDCLVVLSHCGLYRYFLFEVTMNVV
jgi:hypothetical protein